MDDSSTNVLNNEHLKLDDIPTVTEVVTIPNPQDIIPDTWQRGRVVF